MILAFVSSVMIARASEGSGAMPTAPEAILKCQGELTSPIILPHELVARDRDEVARDVIAKARGVLVEQPGGRGVNAAFALVESSIAPTLENVAVFLQTRRHYPTVFEGSEVANQTSKIHGELLTRLEQLKTRGEPIAPSPSWRFWKSTPTVVDKPSLILQIRRLHHYLLEMTGALRENTKMLDRVLPTAVALQESIHRDFEVLRQVNGQIREAEFNLRVEDLRRDLVVQAGVIDNMVLMLKQQIEYDGIIQDRVRSLLKAYLPVIAMTGNSELDLSPLAPEEAARAGPSDEAAGDSGEVGARVSVDAIIRLADRTTNADAANSMIEGYVRKYSALLSVDDVLRLGPEAKTWASSDQMLVEWAKTNLERLTLPDVLRLVDGIFDHDSKDEVLLMFAQRYARTMHGDALVEVAEKSNFDGTRRKIMALVNI